MKVLFIVASALISTGAWGSTYFTLGEGNTDCTEHMSHKKIGGSAYLAELNWVTGFISGANFSRASSTGMDSMLGNKLEFDSIANWLEIYCTTNPSHKLTSAAGALDMFLKINQENAN